MGAFPETPRTPRSTKVAKPAFIEEDEGILRTLAAQQPHRLRPASVPRGRRDAGPQPGPFAAVLAELGTTVKKGECKDQGTSDKCSILADTGKKCCWCVNLDAEIAECLDEKDAKVKLALDPNLICDPPPEDDGGGGSGSDDDEGGGGSGSDGGGGSADKITLLPGYQLTPMQARPAPSIGAASISHPTQSNHTTPHHTIDRYAAPSVPRSTNGWSQHTKSQTASRSLSPTASMCWEMCATRRCAHRAHAAGREALHAPLMAMRLPWLRVRAQCLSLTPLVSRLLDGYRETNAPQEMSESRLVLAFDWARYPSGGDLGRCRRACTPKRPAPPTPTPPPPQPSRPVGSLTALAAWAKGSATPAARRRGRAETETVRATAARCDVRRLASVTLRCLWNCGALEPS